jgi:TPR repeat protein
MIHIDRRKTIAVILIFFAVTVKTFLFAQREDIQTMIVKAERGDLSSQYNLGVRFYRGDGTPQDLKQAAFWYEKAATQGSVEAQYMAGYLYGNVPTIIDLQKSIQWYS